MPPLVQLQKLIVDTSLLGLLARPIHVRSVRLQGLQLTVARGSEPDGIDGRPKKQPTPDFLVGEIVADGTRLVVLPKKRGKEPLLFDLERLKLHSVGRFRPMAFESVLTNPKPPGPIHTRGEFGAWNPDDPGLTPVSGTYVFRGADLAEFDGIAGILSSEGSYRGRLDRIDVDGTTDTPTSA